MLRKQYIHVRLYILMYDTHAFGIKRFRGGSQIYVCDAVARYDPVVLGLSQYVFYSALDSPAVLPATRRLAVAECVSCGRRERPCICDNTSLLIRKKCVFGWKMPTKRGVRVSSIV